MRCPVCRAELTAGPQCRRCRADLSLLFALAKQRDEALKLGLSLAAHSRGDEAVALAEQAEWLQHGDDARRLQAVGRLLQGDFRGAWDCYRQVSRQPLPGSPGKDEP